MKTLKRYTGTCFYKNIATLEVLKELLLLDRLGLNKKNLPILNFFKQKGHFFEKRYIFSEEMLYYSSQKCTFATET